MSSLLCSVSLWLSLIIDVSVPRCFSHQMQLAPRGQVDTRRYHD
jgi:hypothetical protein